jgi:hypothetical protein
MPSLAELLAARPEGELPPLVTLDSGATISLDRAGRWLHRSAEGPTTAFGPDTAHAFAEVVEQPRDAFEEALAAGARAAELPPDEVVLSFPTLEVTRAVLAKNYAYLTRLALAFIRPSELREMRAAIVAVVEAKETPGPIRDLARRLTVPEGSG